MNVKSHPTNKNPKKKGIVRRAFSRTYSLLGFKDVVQGLESQAANVGEAVDRNKALFKGYKDALKRRQNVRVETFEEAVSRLKLSKEDLQARRRELVGASLLFFAIFLGTFFAMVNSLLDGYWVNSFTLLTICLTLGALIFSMRFRVWQIEKQYLGGPAEYCSDIFSVIRGKS